MVSADLVPTLPGQCWVRLCVPSPGSSFQNQSLKAGMRWKKSKNCGAHQEVSSWRHLLMKHNHGFLEPMVS